VASDRDFKLPVVMISLSLRPGPEPGPDPALNIPSACKLHTHSAASQHAATAAELSDRAGGRRPAARLRRHVGPAGSAGQGRGLDRAGRPECPGSVSDI
jgi:hypothetical protein